MERKVGEVFEHNGVKLKVREFTHADGFTCESCFFFWWNNGLYGR